MPIRRTVYAIPIRYGVLIRSHLAGDIEEMFVLKSGDQYCGLSYEAWRNVGQDKGFIELDLTEKIAKDVR